MRTLSFIFLLVPLLLACGSDANKEQVETLQIIIQEAESDNISIVMEISESVEELGQKEVHLEVLGRVRNLITLRKKYAYQLNNIGDAENFEPKNLDKFLDEISSSQAESVVSMEVINQKIDTYRTRIDALSKSEEYLNDYLIMVNLLYLEAEILHEYAKYFGHS